MKFYIEWENSLRKIYCKEIRAVNLEEAEKLFAVQHPDGKILKIEGRNGV